MAETKPQTHQNPGDEEEALSKEVEELLLTLPKEKGWRSPHLYNYQGFWANAKDLPGIISSQRHFKACDSDSILVSFPKSGTTWLKALIFAIAKRKIYAIDDHNLLRLANPHELVPFIEYKLYANNPTPNLTNIPHPRLFASHFPYSSLPESIKTSDCKIVYVCRNLLDNFNSLWHFVHKARPKYLGSFSMEEALDMFCRGISVTGPFWNHVLGYWKASLENPDKVLFLKYEDMKDDIISHLKRLAEFLGCSFSAQEESDKVIEEISKLCSFESLKEMEPNKSGHIEEFELKSFFRKGATGDWANHLTPSMAKRLSDVVKEKLSGSGLSFTA